MANPEVSKGSTVTCFAIAGAIVPVILMIAKFLELSIDRNAVPYSSLYGIYFWPTSLLLNGSMPEWGASSIFWLTFSILANAVLYMVVGSAMCKLVKLAAFRSRVR